MAPKRVYLRYFFAVLAIYAAGIVIGAALYPGGFSILTVYVSYLGGDPENPIGRYPYNATVLIAGILLIPHFIYLYRRLTPACKIISFLACLCGIVGAAGFASLGIFHQGFIYIHDSHRWATDMAFGGLGGSAFFMLMAFIRKSWMTRSWPKWWHTFIVYAQILGIVGVALLFSETDLFTGLPIDPAFFQDKFWEWFYTFAVMGWLIEIGLIVPKEADPKRTI